MKKFIAIILSLFILVGCSTKTVEEDKHEGEKTIGDLKVGAFFGGPRGDSGIVDMIANAVEELREEHGTKISIVEGSDGSEVDVAKLTSGLLDLSDGGYDMIMIQGSGLNDVVAEVAPSYPETAYVIFDSVFDFEQDPIDNIYAASFKQNEGAFMAGALAMLSSEAKQVGFVGGQEVTVILDFMWGYTEGAKYVEPEGKVNISFTGDWYNSSKSKEIAMTQANLGSDVIFPAAGPSSEGVMQGGAEANYWTIGVDIDRAAQYKETHPDWVEKILSSQVKKADSATKRAVDLYLKGELKLGENEFLGIKEDGVGLVKDDNYKKLVSQEVQTKIEEIEDKISSGEIVVGTAYDKSAKEIQELKDFAK